MTILQIALQRIGDLELLLLLLYEVGLDVFLLQLLEFAQLRSVHHNLLLLLYVAGYRLVLR